MTEREHQSILAKQYQEEVAKLKQEEINQRNNAKQIQAKYNDDLNQQIRETNKKKTYAVLMSEYERSINDKDIKAYQKMDNESLSAKIPGFNPSNPQEKYIDKAMNIDGDCIHNKNTMDKPE